MAIFAVCAAYPQSLFDLFNPFNIIYSYIQPFIGPTRTPKPTDSSTTTAASTTAAASATTATTKAA